MKYIQHEYYLVKVSYNYSPSGHCIAQYIAGKFHDERTEEPIDVIKVVKHLE